MLNITIFVYFRDTGFILDIGYRPSLVLNMENKLLVFRGSDKFADFEDLHILDLEKLAKNEFYKPIFNTNKMFKDIKGLFNNPQLSDTIL